MTPRYARFHVRVYRDLKPETVSVLLSSGEPVTVRTISALLREADPRPREPDSTEPPGNGVEMLKCLRGLLRSESAVTRLHDVPQEDMLRLLEAVHLDEGKQGEEVLDGVAELITMAIPLFEGMRGWLLELENAA